MIIVANWKAKVTTVADAKKLVAAAKKSADKKVHTIVLAPPAPYLGLLSLDNKTKVQFAAQDITVTEGGAATGETTGGMIASVKATYVIIGHSERRALGENDEMVQTKVTHALASGLIPIVCVGEKERDAEAHYLATLRKQLDAVYGGLSARAQGTIILAYEPVWAIGKSAAEGSTPEDLTEMVNYIRKVLSAYLPKKKADTVSILYGGAVEASNAKMLAKGTGITGLLVGHASVDAKTFTALVNALS